VFESPRARSLFSLFSGRFPDLSSKLQILSCSGF
jgi:hypothetical protein